MGTKIYLEEIVNQKRKRMQERKLKYEDIIKNINLNKSIPSFSNAMKKEGLSIIGEVKKASPSKGLIKEQFNPIEIAKQYENCVDAVSVLTEEDYFLGKDDYLYEISKSIKLPTLCKDFIIDPIQIYLAKALGASCVLLIVAILTNKELEHFIKITKEIGIDALVEVHNKEELNRALAVDSNIIGINNRDLKTFKTNLDTTLNLRKYIPKDKIVISESGIHNINHIKTLKEVNIDGILVGESFMKATDINKHAKELKDAYVS